MAHDTISLPKELNGEQRRALSEQIMMRISEWMDNVPVRGTVHAPDPGNNNWHLHTSHSLRQIIDDGGDNFHLGDRIAFEQRPQWRAEHGLEKTNHNDLRTLRQDIANECALALEKAGADRNLCERWRYGYLRLNVGDDNQITRARERGDADFVRDNEFRETQRHEGPGRRRDGVLTPNQGHNASLEKDMSPRILAGKILANSLLEAKETKAQSWEDLREIAARKGIQIEYVRRQHKSGDLGKVTGWRCHVMGSVVSGQQAGLTLRAASKDLQEAGMEWAKEAPQYTEMPNTKMEKGAPQKAVQDLQIGAVEASLERARSPRERAKEDVRTQSAAPKAPAPARALKTNTSDPRQRPKRRSSTDHLKGKGAAMDVNAVMKSLIQLPAEPEQVQPAAPVQPARAPLADLNDFERTAMLNAYPNQREIQRQQRRATQAIERRKLLMESEPKRMTGLIFKKPSQAHADWRKRVGEMNRCIQMTQQHIEKWLDEHVYSDPVLIARIQRQREEQEAHRRQIILQEYEKTERILQGQNVYNRSMYQQTQVRRLRENPWLVQIMEERAEAEAQARAEAEKQVPAQAQKQDQTQTPISGGSSVSPQPPRPRG